MEPRIGLDVGGVIIRSIEQGSDTSFFKDNFLDTPATPHAIETITEIVETYGPKNVFIISKCGRETQIRTITWLMKRAFFTTTGMYASHIHFCISREEKAPIANGLQLSHFVDDREDVLGFMDGIVPNRILFMPSGPPKNEHLLPACSWTEVLEILSKTKGCVAKSG